MVDLGNPVVFLKAEALGKRGDETPEELDGDEKFMAKLEEIRGLVAKNIGLEKSPAFPFISIVSPPRDFRAIGGVAYPASSCHFLARIVGMGRVHKAFAGTGAVCCAVAAQLEGSIVNEVAGRLGRQVLIGHPSGVMEVEAEVEGDKVLRASYGRTARKIMEGFVYV